MFSQLIRFLLFILLSLAGLNVPLRAEASTENSFNAGKAWESFATLLHEQYGYYSRPGIDGDKILEAFESKARSARTDEEFIDILQLVSHNFADPHFVVGPLNTSDWAIIPTTSDMFGRYRDQVFLIADVRQDGDAAARGVRAGMSVRRVDGQSPREAIEEITGRPFDALSPQQIDFAFNVALAGRRKQARVLEAKDGKHEKKFALAPTAAQADRVDAGPLLSVTRQGTLGIVRINNSLGNPKLIEDFSKALESLADTERLLIDLRNTPSGGNTSVARGLMGHFVEQDRPYQMHIIPYEARVLGPPRKFLEFVRPFGRLYTGKVYVAGGHWTGSMGEGLMIGFEALGATTIGSELAHLLGALSNETINHSAARIDIGTEQLFTVSGLPRESFRPQTYLEKAEPEAGADPVLATLLE